MNTLPMPMLTSVSVVLLIFLCFEYLYVLDVSSECVCVFILSPIKLFHKDFPASDAHSVSFHMHFIIVNKRYVIISECVFSVFLGRFYFSF